jgi:CrcB protein
VSGIALACAVAGAGGIGATTRFVTDRYLTDRVTSRIGVTDFPVGTTTVNVLGSFILGFVAAFVDHHHLASSIELIIGSGFCGGLTTFSSASFETVRLIGNGEFRLAAANAVGGLTLCCCVGAIGLGLGSL